MDIQTWTLKTGSEFFDFGGTGRLLDIEFVINWFRYEVFVLPKAAKQHQETSGKKISKQKRKAALPLNDVAGTIVVGEEQNISNNRKVKT